MARTSALRWTGPALEDLRSIRDWVAAEGKPEAAKRLADKIRRRVSGLPDHPRVGRRVPEFPDSAYREVFVGPYRIVYEPSGEQIVILRIWHGRRDLSRISRIDT